LLESTRIGSARLRTPTALGELVDQVQGVPHSAAQPVQGVHHDHVTGPGVVEQNSQPVRVGRGAGLLVQIDPLGRDPGGAQCVELRARSCLAVETRA